MPRSLIWPVYAVLTFLVLAPLWSMQVPGLGDTLNHLARMHVLATIDTSPALHRFYEVHWSPIPYLAMDAIVPLLARVMPLYLAGKIFVMCCALMPVIGAASLHYAIHRRASLVPAAAFLLSYNYLLACGFLNYLFSAGLAMVLFAVWVAAASWPRWRRAAVFAPLVTLLYFGHAFACAAYCLSVAGFELSRAARQRFSPPASVAADFLAAGAQAIPALCFAATLNVSAGYVGALQTHYGDLATKITALLSPVMFLLDFGTVVVLLAACLLAVVLLRWLRLSRHIWPSALLVALAAAAMPNMVASTWGMDLRFPIFAAMLLLGAMSFRPRPVWVTRSACAGLVVLVGLKSVFALPVLRQLDARIGQTRALLAHMPPGERLLIVSTTAIRRRHEALPVNTIWNMPLVAVIDRDAFVPIFFNGLTSVRMQPDFMRSSTPNGFPVTPAQLASSIDAHDEGGTRLNDGEGAGGSIYWLGWPQKFDYVLVQAFGTDPGAMPANLSLAAASQDMSLYRITPPRDPPPSGDASPATKAR
jgi:hypothetical protein